MKTITKLWIGLGILVVLSPLGLILPEHFKAGSAWGEWGSDEIQKLIGYVPEKLAKLSEIWKAPMPDYEFKGWEEKSMAHLSLAYIVSAIVGIIIIAVVVMFIGKLLVKNNK